MDVDEFLDRELMDLGISKMEDKKSPANETQSDSQKPKETLKEPSKEIPKAAQKIPEKIDTSPSAVNFDKNKSIVLQTDGKSKEPQGRLEEDEQKYNSMWDRMMHQLPSLNKASAAQLLNFSKNFGYEVNEAYKQANIDLKKSADMVRQARALLREGKKDMAFRIYSELDKISSLIPGIFFEEKTRVSNEQVELYQELKKSTDAELMKRISHLFREISINTEKSRHFLSQNDSTNASNAIQKSISLLKQVPDGFLKQKIEVGSRLLDICIAISDKNQGLQNNQPIDAGEQMESLSKSRDAINNLKAQEIKSKARISMKKGQYVQALGEIEEVLLLKPNDTEAKVLKAKIITAG